MDYEKKYKKALGWMQSVYPTMTGTVKEDAEHYFPELKESKESDEERIRKDIISYLKSSTAISPKTWIAWLEKQKVLTTEEDLQGKEDVLWCIKQAKKYAKDENEMGTCWFAEKWLEKQGEQKPTIEMKSAEESLGIDSDTYNKIVDECIYGEQKPAETAKGANGNEREIPFSEQKWSEEDEKNLNRIYTLLAEAANKHAFSTTCRLIGDKECVELQDFLKSLRPQNQWKPSDEQMDMLSKVCSTLHLTSGENEIMESIYDALKKLKDEK